MNGRIIFWSITSALAGFLFGFDTVVISGAEQKIQMLLHVRHCQITLVIRLIRDRASSLMQFRKLPISDGIILVQHTKGGDRISGLPRDEKDAKRFLIDDVQHRRRDEGSSHRDAIR